MKKWLFLGILTTGYAYFKFLKGILMRNNRQYQCYGVTNEYDLIGAILYVSFLFNLGANRRDLALNLYEIAITESNLATSLYNPDRGFGYGAFQFDPVAWKDIRARFVNNSELALKCILLFQFDPRQTDYSQLKTDIVKATVYARAYLLWRIPSAIGSTMEVRGQQWATYYNTPAGASKGKPDLYIKRVNAMRNNAFFKMMGGFNE